MGSIEKKIIKKELLGRHISWRKHLLQVKFCYFVRFFWLSQLKGLNYTTCNTGKDEPYRTYGKRTELLNTTITDYKCKANILLPLQIYTSKWKKSTQRYSTNKNFSSGWRQNLTICEITVKILKGILDMCSSIAHNM